MIWLKPKSNQIQWKSENFKNPNQIKNGLINLIPKVILKEEKFNLFIVKTNLLGDSSGFAK